MVAGGLKQEPFPYEDRDQLFPEVQNIREQADSDVIDAKIQYKISDAELKKAFGTLK